MTENRRMNKAARRKAPSIGEQDSAERRQPADNGEFPIRYVTLRVPLCDPPEHWAPGTKIEVWTLTLRQRQVLAQLRQALFQEKATTAPSEEFRDAPQPVVGPGRGTYGNILKWLLTEIATVDDGS